MFKRILVPVDGSESAARALEVARALAVTCSATLVLLEIVAPPYEFAHGPHDGPPALEQGAHDPEEEAIALARRHLERLASTLRGVVAEVDVRSGRPAEAIERTLADMRCDLICVALGHQERVNTPAGAAASSGNPWLLPGVIERLVHSAPAPVLVVR